MRTLVMCALAAWHLPAQTPVSSAPQPDRLQVENRVSPLGLDVATPRLSWNLTWAGAVQQACQVRAARTAALLLQGAAELWDSGRVDFRRSAVEWAHLVHIGSLGSPNELSFHRC